MPFAVGALMNKLKNNIVTFTVSKNKLAHYCFMMWAGLLRKSFHSRRKYLYLLFSFHFLNKSLLESLLDDLLTVFADALPFYSLIAHVHLGIFPFSISAPPLCSDLYFWLRRDHVCCEIVIPSISSQCFPSLFLQSNTPRSHAILYSKACHLPLKCSLWWALCIIKSTAI